LRFVFRRPHHLAPFPPSQDFGKMDKPRIFRQSWAAPWIFCAVSIKDDCRGRREREFEVTPNACCVGACDCPRSACTYSVGASQGLGKFLSRKSRASVELKWARVAIIPGLDNNTVKHQPGLVAAASPQRLLISPLPFL